MKKAGPAPGGGPQVAQRVDGVGGPGRSMSTRLTLNLGFDAVATTVIR